MTANLQADLNQFTGTEGYYKYGHRILLTDGVKYLADEAEAYWLLDAIVSYQNDRRVKSNRMLREIQFWELKVKDGRGELTCVEDSGRPPVIRQEVAWTDFPLESVKLYLENGVLMLPSER